ncbi:uncharacterized protein [Scyliorhinus torazame]|uniref:uncharacterized protein isoform X2 n=1 Tax=Scyliorhinus torazame TaxID=75743 RepID=UPI003B5A6DFD
MQAVSGEFSLSIVGMWAPQTGPEFIAQRVKHVAVDLKSHVGQASSRDSDQIPEDRRLENATLIFKKVPVKPAGGSRPAPGRLGYLKTFF